MAELMILLLAIAGGQEETVDFELRSNLIFVKTTVDGKGPYTFLFDTGSKTTILSGKLVAGRRTIAVGRAVVRNLGCGRRADLGHDGVLGADFISRFITTIDYRRKTLRLVPHRRAGGRA